MSAATAFDVPVDDLWAVVTGVWESLLDRPASLAGTAGTGADEVTSSIALHGDQEGVVTFACSAAAAEAITRLMLDVPDGAPVTPDDVQDAVCEVVNVVGGNVKALLEGSTRLSLPEWGGTVPPADGELVRHLAVEWDGHVARVCVWHCPSTVESTTRGGAR